MAYIGGTMRAAAQGQDYSSALGGYQSDATQAGQRPPEVPEKIDQLDKALAYVEESLKELQSRLGGVMRSAPPESAGTNKIEGGPATAYGGMLHGLGTRAERIGDRMRDILQRLEL